jgi:hypothetical protein
MTDLKLMAQGFEPHEVLISLEQLSVAALAVVIARHENLLALQPLEDFLTAFFVVKAEVTDVIHGVTLSDAGIVAADNVVVMCRKRLAEFILSPGIAGFQGTEIATQDAIFLWPKC